MKKKEKKLDKFAIAAALQEIAALLELKGGKDRFKARAYQAGARVIAGMGDDLDKIIKEDRLTSMRGIGDALASQIKQLYLSGESSVLRGLRKDFPPGIIELSGVPGLSISKIKTLHDELGISSIAELKRAAETGQIKEVKGFGARTEARLLESIGSHRRRDKGRERLHLHRALQAAANVINYLATEPGVIAVQTAGSLRRWKETVGTIRLVVNTNRPAAVIERFVKFPLIVQVIERLDEAATVQLADGSRVSLVAARPEEFALALLTETGSRAHINKLRQIAGVYKPKVKSAKKKRPRGSEYISPDAEIYEQLGMQ